MACSCLGEFNRPTIFNCVANGLASSSLNPTFGGAAAAPLRFIAALVVAFVSPIFAACDIFIYIVGSILFAANQRWDWSKQNLQDCGILLLRVIPDTISFPFVFTYNPDLYHR